MKKAEFTIERFSAVKTRKKEKTNLYLEKEADFGEWNPEGFLLLGSAGLGRTGRS